MVLSSCSSPPGRDYAVPDDLCGLKIPQRYYSSLFGPGKEIEVDKLWRWGNGTASQGCDYLVDGNPKVSVVGRWAKRNDTVAASTPAEAIEQRNTRDTPKKYPGRYDVATWSAGGVAAIDCPRAEDDPEKEYNRFLVDVYANDTPLNDDPDRAHKVFGKLAQTVMSKVVRKLPCTGK
ncbi:hypothetical protein JW613_32265 [Streptomyces smyrnaeus]|uniref:DUF3558 domain-containing protein n=1 Tax=Streptomyces smyrnaeus TaxID=1387713 RepID=A0ABS3Y5K5_9ACTN|nr:hypothetical protein [Streptomyces smyrnaeus]MBO8202916.1 hypothetical protein [Streptomyces smyrnaeus]